MRGESFLPLPGLEPLGWQFRPPPLSLTLSLSHCIYRIMSHSFSSSVVPVLFILLSLGVIFLYCLILLYFDGHKIPVPTCAGYF